MGFIWHLYSLSHNPERVMMIVGTTCAILAGLTIPLNSLAVGHIINLFLNVTTKKSASSSPADYLEDRTTYLSQFTFGIAAGSVITSYGAVALWSWNAARLGAEIRKRYFIAVLSQSIGWFEINDTAELIRRFEMDIPTILDGVGEKVPAFFQWLTSWLCSHIVAFSQSWKLTLAVMFFSPLAFLVSGYLIKIVYDITIDEYQNFITAGLSAEEAIIKIDTIHAFNAYDWESQRYARNLQMPKVLQIKKAMILSVGSFFPWVVNTLTFCVAFGYGNYLILEENLQPGSIFTVLFVILFATASAKQAFFSLEAISSANFAIPQIREVMDLESAINCFSTTGKIDEDGLQGAIDFRGVFFKYPANPRSQVLNSLDLKIRSGERVAIVGDKNSGVSAIPKLIQRFYDIHKGQILIDNTDIREYNVFWLRNQMGYVSKEPVLFPVSVSENIRHGRDDVTEEQIEAAAIAANAHDFIRKLPQGYDTVIAEDISQVPPTESERLVNRHVSPHSEKLGRGINALKQTSAGLTVDVRQRKISSQPISKRAGGDAVPVPAGPRQRHRQDHRQSIFITESDPDLFSSSRQTINVDQSGLVVKEISTTAVESQTLAGPSTEDADGESKVALTLRQRVQLDIARALVSRPAILLLEDVTRLLDNRTLDKLKEAIKVGGQTTILITSLPSHNFMAERLIMVSRGRKVEAGTRKELEAKKGWSVFQALNKQEIIEAGKRLAAFSKTMMRRNLSQIASQLAKIALDLQADHLMKAKAEVEVIVTPRRLSFLQTLAAQHPVARLLLLQYPDLFYISLGLICAIVVGLAPVVFAFVLGNIIEIWYDREAGISSSKKFGAYELLYILMAVSGIVIFLRMLLHYCFSYSGARLTARIRALMFEALLKQDLEFFDRRENSPRKLAHTLIHDPVQLQGVVGGSTAALLETVTTVTAGITMALLTEWRTALVIITFMPLSILGSFLQGKVLLNAESCNVQYMHEAREVLTEAFQNITTVTLLGMQQLYVDRFESIVDNHKKKTVKYAHLHGLGHGFLNAVNFVFSAVLLVGSYLVRTGRASFPRIFLAFSYLIIGTAELDISQPKSILLHFTRSIEVATKIFQLLDRKLYTNDLTAGGKQLTDLKGLVVFDNVIFHYPCNPTVRVLNKLNLLIRPGTTVALVGPRGSGKTTTFMILQRCYGIDSGSVKVDGKPLDTFDLMWWRSQLGVIQEETDLMVDTVKNNITYGDSREFIPLEEVVMAAKEANIHAVINSLSDGYNTKVTLKGTGSPLTKEQLIQLAIARAIFRNPPILLVDNITASLDPWNTKNVLEALKSVSMNRTCLIATSNIEEIQHADLIFVLHQGHVIESGNHRELLALKGCYAMLLMKQQKARKDQLAAHRLKSEKMRKDSKWSKDPRTVLRGFRPTKQLKKTPHRMGSAIV